MERSEDFSRVFQEIENKYSTTSNVVTDELAQQLQILSQEFDTLGLPPLELKPSNIFNVLQSIVNSTFLLIQSHRKTLLHVTDMNISHRSKDTRTDDLQKNILKLKTQLEGTQNENLNLERKLLKSIGENEDFRKKLSIHTKETDQLKKFHASKQNQLIHRISNLENENHHLREICGKDFDKYFSKEEKFLKILKAYKDKEETYKEALKKLEENNVEIMNEILNLKSELALAYLKNDT